MTSQLFVDGWSAGRPRWTSCERAEGGFVDVRLSGDGGRRVPSCRGS